MNTDYDDFDFSNYYDGPVFPGIEIQYAIISPTSGEVFFVDAQNRKLLDNTVPNNLTGSIEGTAFWDMDINTIRETNFGFFSPEGIGIIEVLVDVAIVADSNGNLFHKVSFDSLESSAILNSFFFATSDELIAVNRIYNDSSDTNDFSCFSIIALFLLVIIMICVFAWFRKNKKVEHST